MTVVSELGEWNGMDAYFVVEAALETEYSCMVPVKKLSDSVYRAIDEMLSDGLIVHGEYESHYKFADIQTLAARALDKNQSA